jgi:hypothetical protein
VSSIRSRGMGVVKDFLEIFSVLRLTLAEQAATIQTILNGENMMDNAPSEHC